MRGADEENVWAAEIDDIAAHWPVPGPHSDKYSCGVVGIDTGSQHYPGAGVLSTGGALHAGAGMIRFCGAQKSADIIALTMPSVTFGPGQVQAWVVGCGWGQRDDNAQRLAVRLADGAPMVIDADALATLPVQLPDNCLLTPHAGELARMLGVEREKVQAEPLASARQAAVQFGATVLLKGATQYVVELSGEVTLAVPGPAWTARAGSGDTLAGICGSLLAAGLSARWAGVLGASIQAMTAARHPGPFTPDEIAGFLPSVIAEIAEKH